MQLLNCYNMSIIGRVIFRSISSMRWAGAVMYAYPLILERFSLFRGRYMSMLLTWRVCPSKPNKLKTSSSFNFLDSPPTYIRTGPSGVSDSFGAELLDSGCGVGDFGGAGGAGGAVGGSGCGSGCCFCCVADGSGF